MKGLLPLFLGVFGTFAFSWVGLSVIPNYQIGHLDPQMDEEGTDIYPMPKSGMADRGRHIYTGNGCFYCHSQQIRPDYIASDLDRVRDAASSPAPKWGQRRSAPRDYIFDRPTSLGKMRMGPDLADVGKAAPPEDENASAAEASPAASPAPAANASPGASPAANASLAGSPAAKPGASPAASQPPAKSTAAASPSNNAAPPTASPGQGASPAPVPSPAATLTSANGEPLPYSVAWHHKHLYAPRSLNSDSNMPAYRFLYEKRRISGERSADALPLTGRDAPAEGWEVVPTYEAQCLVAYLMSLDQSHPLKEVKSGAPAPAAPAPAPAAGSSPAASPPPPPK